MEKFYVDRKDQEKAENVLINKGINYELDSNRQFLIDEGDAFEAMSEWEDEGIDFGPEKKKREAFAVEDEDEGMAAEALDDRGIPYTIDSNKRFLVEDKDYFKVRCIWDSKGVRYTDLS